MLFRICIVRNGWSFPALLNIFCKNFVFENTNWGPGGRPEPLIAVKYTTSQNLTIFYKCTIRSTSGADIFSINTKLALKDIGTN